MTPMKRKQDDDDDSKPAAERNHADLAIEHVGHITSRDDMNRVVVALERRRNHLLLVATRLTAGTR